MNLPGSCKYISPTSYPWTGVCESVLWTKMSFAILFNAVLKYKLVTFWHIFKVTFNHKHMLIKWQSGHFEPVSNLEFSPFKLPISWHIFTSFDHKCIKFVGIFIFKTENKTTFFFFYKSMKFLRKRSQIKYLRQFLSKINEVVVMRKPIDWNIAPITITEKWKMLCIFSLQS